MLFFRHVKMSKADMVKLALAALVAYFTAAVSTEHRMSIVETRIDLIEKIDANVQWLVKETVDISARVRHLEDNSNREAARDSESDRARRKRP